MHYSDDILNVYAYLFSKSKNTADASRDTAAHIAEVRASMDELQEEISCTHAQLDDSIAELRRMAEEMGIDVSDISSTSAAAPVESAEKKRESDYAKIHLPDDFNFESDFKRLVNEAHAAGFADVHPEDLLSEAEMEYVKDFSDKLDAEFAAATQLSRGDITVLTVAVVVRILLFFLLRHAQTPLYETAGAELNEPEKVAIPSSSGIDATLGVDIGDMLRDIPPTAKRATTIAAETLKFFGQSSLPVHILDTDSILTMDKPFDLQNTGLFAKTDIIAYNRFLGWVIGVANLMTNTVTTFNMKSYSVNRKDPYIKPFADKEISTLSVLRPVLRNISAYKPSVVAAVIQEALTLGFGNASPSQVRTLFSRSIGVENHTADILDKAAHVMRRVNSPLASYLGGIATITLINTIISAVHAMMYDEEKDGPLDMYSIRTGKIILLSGAIATSANSLPTLLTGNFNDLDIAGILTTCVSLFQSTKFWIDVKVNFLCSEYKKELDAEMQRMDKYFN